MKAIRIFAKEMTVENKTFTVFKAYYGEVKENDEGELEFIDFIGRDCIFSKEIDTKKLPKSLTLIDPVEKVKKEDNGDYWFLPKKNKSTNQVYKTKNGKVIKRFVIMSLKNQKDVKWAISKANADDELNEYKKMKESKECSDRFVNDVKGEHYSKAKEENLPF